MKAKFIFIAIALFLAVGSASAYIPTIEADIIFDGFGGGSVSGIVFGPTSETVIVMHEAQPVEIDIKTKQIVREFEKVPNNIGSGNSPIFIKDKNYFTAYVTSTELFGVKDFGGNVIWDYTTGKIIKALQDVFLLTDGIKYYSRGYSDNYTKEYVGLYDINTFKYKDSVEFDLGWYHGQQMRFLQCFIIIPNSNKVIVGANVSGSRATLYILDFDTKEYTEIPIPYDKAQKSSPYKG